MKILYIYPLQNSLSSNGRAHALRGDAGSNSAASEENKGNRFFQFK